MIVFLVGPTAVGKSEVAFHLAQEEGAAILSLDSMQVYRGLDIGTGKPTPSERAAVPHGGLDLVPWWEQLDTARYLQAAAEFLKEHAGRTIYVVGGTGLYFRALTRGLSAAPAASPEARAAIQALPLAALQERLRALDPDQEPGFDWNNPRRIARSLEVIQETGIPLREWHRRSQGEALVPSYRAFLLLRERDALRERIARRTAWMLAHGWADEVRGLIAERSVDEVKNCAAIGYRLLAEALETGRHPDSVRQAIVDETRQYAKRQLTWFQREPTVRPLMIPEAETPAQTALSLRSLLAIPA